jgi:hypothetical protein
MSRLFLAVAFAAVLLPATGFSSAQVTRPHNATCVAVPEDPLAPIVHATGTCQTTHLGRDRFESTHTVIPVGLDADAVLLTVVGGTETHIAANGDVLHGVYEGTARVLLLTGRVAFDLQGHYTGGTGRFAGASGATHISGVEEEGVARFTEEGSITY